MDVIVLKPEDIVKRHFENLDKNSLKMALRADIPHSVHEVAKLDKLLEDKVLMLAEKSAIADKIQSVDNEQLKSFVRGIKSAMDFNEHNHKQLLDLATYSNNAFDAREFALHTGMVGDQGVVAYDKALQDLADAGILKSVDDGWKYKLTDEAAYLIKQTYNVVEAEKVTQQEISASQANISAENHRLFVPYEQKDVASSLGARWDKENKYWYAPAGSDLDKFKPWLKEPVREFISPETEFARQLEAHGLHLESGHPIMDGRWHRLKVDGDRTGKSGAYIGHLDGVPRGTVKNFKTGQETNWTAKDAVVKSVPSSLDIERAKAAAEAKQKASYNQAADAAKLVLNHAQPAQNHPYLDKKGVAAHGVYVVPDKSAVNLDNTNLAIANDWREAKAMRENFKANGIEKQVLTKGDLIVPAMNEHGDVRTFQTISGNNGSFKSFVKGGEKSGSFHVIGDLNNAKDVMIAEGYATAATLHEQTGKPVVVAFDAGNLSPAAEKVRASLPDARIYIAADNDRNNAVNTGIEKANAAAEKIDAKVIVPQFDKLDGAEKLSDWNDLHKANPHDFVAQLATSDMGRQDFTDKLANLPPERQEVFKGWYDYINEKLANHPEARNTKQASLEQEILKAEQGNSNLPSVADYQAQQAVKKQAAQVVTQQPTQQATVAIQAPAVDTTAGKGKGGFDR
ncbi:hypothetical protein B0181_11815 [Moraxella caviae]|uniref:Toprim domain-containing protein n=1 Tax=Moraxella caviae TaxID=34060 RepID=A0A1S9ZRC4_9GAMM|nr:hypothetical protein B0181_11815 [Moraxella caviae]